MRQRGTNQNQPQAQSQSAIMELRDLILTGELAAGERLYEVKLAERLGISRTPLRYAFSQLELEGLLERKSTTGYVVRSFTFDDVADAIELRGVLEGTAARLAAERGVSKDDAAAVAVLLSRIDDALGADESELDLDAYHDANEAFHHHLVSLSRSDILRREVERSARLPFASPSAFLQCQRAVPEFRRSLTGAQIQHRSVMDAVMRREGARAEALMREHARLARTNLEYVINRDRSLMKTVPGLALVVG
ncbi:GntR family transcriptional regulator [Fulvimarina sp. MAC8]|uniref:GntR family transcriptional regulator n=1 Tax=Fulvimarina sp. MAC8 TaxID=3162874 RepID=UPI0032EC1DD6